MLDNKISMCLTLISWSCDKDPGGRRETFSWQSIHIVVAGQITVTWLLYNRQTDSMLHKEGDGVPVSSRNWIPCLYRLALQRSSWGEWVSELSSSSTPQLVPSLTTAKLLTAPYFIVKCNLLQNAMERLAATYLLIFIMMLMGTSSRIKLLHI